MRASMKFGIGQAVSRTEDARFLTGRAQFTDDISHPDQLYLRVLRSPYPHGLVTDLDVRPALKKKGVRAVYTAREVAHLGRLPCRAVLPDDQSHSAFIAERPILAEGRVLFVGQAMAAVVAETPQQAQNAVDAITFSIQEIPACSMTAHALDPDTALLHPLHESNLCLHYQQGDAQAVSAGFQRAAHLVELSLVNNRVAPSPLEPRASLVEPTETGYTIYNPSQGPVAQQAVLAQVFSLPKSVIRIVAPNTGGGFGIRGEVHPELCLALHAARDLGVPIKYTGDRSEMFLGDTHGRDNLTRVRAAFDEGGMLQALRVETTANLGAYCSAVGPFVPTVGGGRILGTVYRVPLVYHSVRCVFTNTMPVAAYRGAGRPEACYVMERLMETAALQLGIDSTSLRRRNLITSDLMPYTLPSGAQLSCGEFGQTLDMALERADWAGFAARAEQTAKARRLRGRGLGLYIESSGGGLEEEAKISVLKDGRIEVVVGTFSHGQGHATTFAQILSEVLDVDAALISIIQGDTDRVAFGGGTVGSRSSQMGGVAVLRAGQGLIRQGLAIAAEMLQQPQSEITYQQGFYSARQQGTQVSLQEVAMASAPHFGGEGLHQTLRYRREPGYTFPNGAHIAEVEVDPETGRVAVVRYTTVDDCGRVINPLLASGQVHGGVAQGIGQALFEEVVYDREGQLVTGSLMDYSMPRAQQLSDIDVCFHEVLDPNNELGVKGIGEGGACAAPAAIANAVLDALRPFGVATLDMPLTSEKVWNAIRAGAEGS